MTTTALEAAGFCPETTPVNLCPSLSYRIVDVDGCALFCEALAKASNFLWERALDAELSDPERFGITDEEMPF